MLHETVWPDKIQIPAGSKQHTDILNNTALCL